MAAGQPALSASSSAPAAPSLPQQSVRQLGLLGAGFTKRKRDDNDTSTAQAAAPNEHPARRALQEAVAHAERQLQQYRLGRSPADATQNSASAAAIGAEPDEEVDAADQKAEAESANEDAKHHPRASKRDRPRKLKLHTYKKDPSQERVTKGKVSTKVVK